MHCIQTLYITLYVLRLKFLTYFISIPKNAGDGKSQSIELWVHMEWREVMKIFCDDPRQVKQGVGKSIALSLGHSFGLTLHVWPHILTVHLTLSL